MLAIDAITGGELSLKFFGATTDAREATLWPISDALPLTPEVCFSKLTITGGLLLGAGPLPASKCPAGSYYHAKESCPTW